MLLVENTQNLEGKFKCHKLIKKANETMLKFAYFFLFALILIFKILILIKITQNLIGRFKFHKIKQVLCTKHFYHYFVLMLHFLKFKYFVFNRNNRSSSKPI